MVKSKIIGSGAIVGFLSLVMVLFISVGSAHAVSLSNTGIGEASIVSDFGFTNDTSNAVWNVSEFDIDGVVGNDGVVWSAVFEGNAASGTEGLFLYAYRIAYTNSALAGTHRITELSTQFSGLADMGAWDSYWLTDYNYPDYNYPNAGADLTGGVISFDFTCCNTLDPGEITTFFGAVSTSAGVLTDATISGYTTGPNGGPISAGTQVYAAVPVPEPSTLLLLGSGFLMVGVFFRRKVLSNLVNNE
ncbi:MAG: hypothetical protein IEMM0002_0282 [bacterium]|nr:MAG: hypothetical protein IEMM0002_0282 [bacterium]